MLQELANQHGFVIETTEDSTQFTASNLSRFNAVVWLSTTGALGSGHQRSSVRKWV
jgi:cytochrome c